MERKKYDSEMESFDSELVCVELKVFTLNFDSFVE
jgi:hypothetical protein